MKTCLLCTFLRSYIAASNLYMTGRSVRMLTREKLLVEDTRHSIQLSHVQTLSQRNLVPGRTDAKWLMVLGKQDCIPMPSERIYVHMEGTANEGCVSLHMILRNFVHPNRDRCSRLQ
uniref:Secreted protein n=1 Tax=Hanusia phi TaxID=3032 RepID=A0A7S0HSQ0_9CRYP